MNSTPLKFAPYQAPPDYPSNPAQSTSSSPWQPPSAEGSNYHSSSYHLPPDTSYANGLHARDLTVDWSNPGTASTLGRYDLEGALAYALGPIGAALMLILELENDWVRFAAWQSGLLSGCLFLVHLCVIPLGKTPEIILFVIDVVVFAWLARRAYEDADLLDRFKLPYLGDMAQRWVEEE